MKVKTVGTPHLSGGVEKFLAMPDVCLMTGLSRTSVYTIFDFPKPIKINGSEATAQGGSRWVQSEVAEWMRSRIQARDTLPPDNAKMRLSGGGRPSKKESMEAARIGLSVRERRAQTRIAGLEIKKQQSLSSK